MRRAGTRGFSLVEALTALALLALLLLALTSALGAGAKVLSRLESREARAGEASARLELLRLLVERARPLRAAGDPSRLRFEGREDALAFIAEADGAAGDGRLYRVELAATARALLVRQCPLTEEDDPCEGAASLRAEIPALAGARLSYGAAEGEGLAWRGAWTRATALPLLVRVAGAQETLAIRLRLAGEAP